jgi:hypothetical protein
VGVTYYGEVGTSYYFEVDGQGAVTAGGEAFTSKEGSTYNFGQQPFATQYDDSQVWSNTSSNITAADAAFNGTIVDSIWTKVGDYAYPNDYSVAGSISGFNVTGSVIEIYMYRAPSLEAVITVNGGTAVPDVSGDNVPQWITTGVTTLTSIDTIAGGKPYIGAVRVDGIILVDTGNPLASAYGNTLFQTWEQWNNVATLRADNPSQVLVFNAIKTAFETYEGDCAECRQEVLNSLVKIVASGVLTNAEEEHLAKFMRTLIN